MVQGDATKKPYDEWTRSICKIGQGNSCCRYLLMGSKGWECGKLDPWMADILDKKVLAGEINAKGDNCTGMSM